MGIGAEPLMWYLLACHRYIELNPVRVGMIEAPADYAWSSYRTNASVRRTQFYAPTLNTWLWPLGQRTMEYLPSAFHGTP
jgi:hypothetical protein